MKLKIVFIFSLLVCLSLSCSSNTRKNLSIEQIEKKLYENKLSDCFEWLVSKTYSSRTKEELISCESSKELITELNNHFQILPPNIFSCNYTAPFVFDGCQSESCYEGYYDLLIKREVDLMSEIINGKKIKTLSLKEKLSKILGFKILVKQIGKAQVSTLAPSIPQIKAGTNIFNIVSYGTEGSTVACFGNEFIRIDPLFTELIPYKAENWIYVETKSKIKGYIPFSALF